MYKIKTVTPSPLKQSLRSLKLVPVIALVIVAGFAVTVLASCASTFTGH